MWSSWGKKPATTPTSTPSTEAATPTMFNGLSVKAADSSASATSSPVVTSNKNSSTSSAFGFLSGSASTAAAISSPPPTASQQPPSIQEQTIPTPSRNSSAFSFLSSGPAAASATSPSAAGPSQSTPSQTGFSFLSGSSPPAAQQSPTGSQSSSHVGEASEAPKSAFGFLSTATSPRGIEVAPVVEKPLPSPDATKAIEQRVNEEMNKRNLQTRMSAEAPLAQASASALNPFMVNQPVRKKKISTKRPGYGRSEDVEEEATMPAPYPPPASHPPIVAESSTSILAGLTVYVGDSGSLNREENERSEHGGNSQSGIQSGGHSPQETRRDMDAVPQHDIGKQQVPQHPEPPAPSARTQGVSSDSQVISRKATEEAQQAPAEENALTPQHKEESSTRLSSLQLFLKSAQTFAASLEQLDAEFHSITEKEVDSQAKKNDLAATIIGLTEDQNRATTEEDFEKAEELQLKIDLIRRELSELDEIINSLGRERLGLDQRREDLFAMQIGEVEKQVDDAETEARHSSAKASSFNQQVHTERSIAKRKLDERDTSLETRMETAKTELALTQEECDKLKERVASGTVELRADRDEWDTKIQAVDEEIALLEKQLEEKKAERSMLAKHLSETDEKISAVAAKYTARLSEVEKRVAQCQSQLAKVSTEQDELNHSRQEMETKIVEQDATLDELNQKANVAKNRFATLERVLARLRQEAAVRRRRITDSQKEAKHLQAVHDDYIWKKSRVELLEKDLIVLETQAMEDGRFLSESAKELPELENQKQMWVTMRNFKEAGRVAADIKTLQSKRQEATKRLEDSKVDLEEKRSNMSSLLAEIQSTKTDLDVLTTKYENQKLAGYVQMARELQNTMDELVSHEPGTPSKVEADGEASNDQEDNTEKVSATPIDDAVIAPIRVMLNAELASVNERIRLVKEKLGDKANPITDTSVGATLNEEGSEVIPDQAPEEAPNTLTSPDEVKEVHADEEIPIEELEKQLEEAVQKEDFELADKLSNQLESLRARAIVPKEPEAASDSAEVEQSTPVLTDKNQQDSVGGEESEVVVQPVNEEPTDSADHGDNDHVDGEKIEPAPSSGSVTIEEVTSGDQVDGAIVTQELYEQENGKDHGDEKLEEEQAVVSEAHTANMDIEKGDKQSEELSEDIEAN